MKVERPEGHHLKRADERIIIIKVDLVMPGAYYTKVGLLLQDDVLKGCGH
jgi:hypothetical protein